MWKAAAPSNLGYAFSLINYLDLEVTASNWREVNQLIAINQSLIQQYNIGVDLSLAYMRRTDIDAMFKFLRLLNFTARNIRVRGNKETNLHFPEMQIEALIWQDSKIFNFSIQQAAGQLDFRELRFIDCSYIAGWSQELYSFAQLRFLSYENSPQFLD